MTPAQYARQGPLARAIIDHDRESVEFADGLAAHPAVSIAWGHTIRARRARRAELSVAAGNLCNRPATPGPNRPFAAAGARR